MMLNDMVNGERIARAVEANVGDLIDKLCEGEPEELRGVVWWILAKRLSAKHARGACFHLPGLDEC